MARALLVRGWGGIGVAGTMAELDLQLDLRLAGLYLASGLSAGVRSLRLNR